MKLIYNFSIMLFLLTSVSMVARAGDDTERREFTKIIKKEFDITKNGTTALYNKYGKVDVKTWDKNRVKIDVTIIVNASSESAAQDVFDRIDINFFNKENYVKAETIINSKNNDWWGGWNDNKSDYSINYEIYMPATNNLELTNKYGDAYVAPISGVASIDVKYGNFKVQGVSNNAKVILAYGNGTLIKGQNLNCNISYGKLDCGEVRDVEITSKYSKLKIDKAINVNSNTKYDTYEFGALRELRNDGGYDNFHIGTAENVIVVSKYTTVNVDKLSNLLDLNLQYGGSSIGSLSKEFTNVNIVGKYTDFKIGIESGANFKFDASTTYAGINYPSGLNVSYEKEKGTSHEVQGHLGKEGGKSVIVARLSYGGLKVRQE